ncbi:MAG TPA: DUF3429 domain-containing protein [Sphingomicrobium sp.]|nr:DUF3429 domain-containing protein [Sphingomicrobium sp.]
MLRSSQAAPERLPSFARWLGVAGLVPQILLAALLIGGPAEFRLPASGLALSYSGLILSFIGGAWWGLASRHKEPVAAWIWCAAVAPSLIAFAGLGACAFGGRPGPGLLLIGTALIGALGIDGKLNAAGLCPAGWLGLRAPLSLGLGGLTILIAVFA